MVCGAYWTPDNISDAGHLMSQKKEPSGTELFIFIVGVQPPYKSRIIQLQLR